MTVAPQHVEHQIERQAAEHSRDRAAHEDFRPGAHCWRAQPPAIEHRQQLTGFDVVAFVEVTNPDGIPGSGDERFRTLSSGGSKLVVGSADARKDKLDTIFKTALVLKF